MSSYFVTTPAAVIRTYKAEKSMIKIASWSTAPTEEEIVRNFFKRSIEILDKGLAFLENKYPYLASRK